MTLHPLQNNILCQVHEGKKTNILLPNGTELQPYAEIMELGPDCHKDTIKVGMKVLFNPSVVIYMDESEGKKIMIVHESACFAEWKEEMTFS